MIVEHKDNLREMTFVLLVDSEGTNKALIQIHASRSSLLGVSDFAEYGLKFIPSKYKFNSDPSINYLSEKSRDVVGLNVDDLEKISSALFATSEKYSEEIKKAGYSYFGSIDISGQTLTMIDVPSGYDYVYLFDLDPETEELDTGESLVDDEWKVKISLDDKKSRKLLWFILSPQGKVDNINLSYLMWSNSNNQERNRNQYLLRNDELEEISNKVDIVSTLGGTDLVVDLNSNTLLGNKKIDYCPLLEGKIFQTYNIPDTDRVTDNSILYRKGTIATRLGQLFLAVKDAKSPSAPLPPETYRVFHELYWIPLSIGDTMEYLPTKCYSTGDEVRYKGKSWVLTKVVTNKIGKLTYTHLLKQKIPSPPSEETGWMEVVETIYNINFPYTRLSRCKYNGYYWVSLVDNNVGNIPGISGSKWILEDKLYSYQDKDLRVVVTPGEGGKVIKKSLRIKDIQDIISIPIELKNYCIDEVTMKVDSVPDGVIKLKEGNNKLLDNKIVNDPSNSGNIFNNYNLSGSYFDGNLTINIDLNSSVGYQGVGSESSWENITFDVPDGFKLLENTDFIRNARYALDNSNDLMNVVLKKNSVVPVINLKVDGEEPKNSFNTGFYTKFKHPLDSNYFAEIRRNYGSINPNGYSFGVLFVEGRPVGYDNKFMDYSGNSTGVNAFTVTTGDSFSFKLLVDPNKYEFGEIVSNYYDPYKSETRILPKTGEFIKKRVGTEKFKDLDFASLQVDDIIDKNAFPIYTVELNSKVYTINIAKFDGFDVSSYSESTTYGGTVKFTIASDQHKMPKISIVKEDDDTNLLSGSFLTPLQNRYYIPGTNTPYVMLGSYLKSGVVSNGELVKGSDYTGTLGINTFGAITRENLTGKHDIIINFAHPEGSTNIFEGDYKIFIEYDN